MVFLDTGDESIIIRSKFMLDEEVLAKKIQITGQYFNPKKSSCAEGCQGRPHVAAHYSQNAALDKRLSQ